HETTEVERSLSLSPKSKSPLSLRRAERQSRASAILLDLHIIEERVGIHFGARDLFQTQEYHRPGAVAVSGVPHVNHDVGSGCALAHYPSGHRSPCRQPAESDVRTCLCFFGRKLGEHAIDARVEVECAARGKVDVLHQQGASPLVELLDV